jgi:hypothetical protein
MRVAAAHRALPTTPKAQRQDGDEKEVKYLEAPRLIRTAHRLTRQAEVVAICNDLAFDRINAMKNQQLLPPDYARNCTASR